MSDTLNNHEPDSKILNNEAKDAQDRHPDDTPTDNQNNETPNDENHNVTTKDDPAHEGDEPQTNADFKAKDDNPDDEIKEKSSDKQDAETKENPDSEAKENLDVDAIEKSDNRQDLEEKSNAGTNSDSETKEKSIDKQDSEEKSDNRQDSEEKSSTETKEKSDVDAKEKSDNRQDSEEKSDTETKHHSVSDSHDAPETPADDHLRLSKLSLSSSMLDKDDEDSSSFDFSTLCDPSEKSIDSKPDDGHQPAEMAIKPNIAERLDRLANTFHHDQKEAKQNQEQEKQDPDNQAQNEGGENTFILLPAVSDAPHPAPHPVSESAPDLSQRMESLANIISRNQSSGDLSPQPSNETAQSSKMDDGMGDETFILQPVKDVEHQDTPPSNNVHAEPSSQNNAVDLDKTEMLSPLDKDAPISSTSNDATVDPDKTEMLSPLDKDAPQSTPFPNNLTSMDTNNDEELAVGTMIGKRYVIDSLIGVGGFGRVYKATDTLSQDKKVAIKTLCHNLDDYKTAATRFMREIQLCREIESSHAIKIYDSGATDNGLLYYVMELLTGEGLDIVIAEGNRLSLMEVKNTMLQALDAIGEAHRKNIIHRDIKPSNLWMGTVKDESKGLRWYVKVLDFGIAKSIVPDPLHTKLTQTGTIMGSPSFMSPEYLRGLPPSTSSDIFALGLICIEMLTGKRVFTGESIMNVAMEIVTQKPVPIDSWILSTKLGPVIQKAVEKDPTKRYQNGDEMAKALRLIDDKALEAEYKGNNIPKPQYKSEQNIEDSDYEEIDRTSETKIFTKSNITLKTKNELQQERFTKYIVLIIVLQVVVAAAIILFNIYYVNLKFAELSNQNIQNQSQHQNK